MCGGLRSGWNGKPWQPHAIWLSVLLLTVAINTIIVSYWLSVALILVPTQVVGSNAALVVGLRDGEIHGALRVARLWPPAAGTRR